MGLWIGLILVGLGLGGLLCWQLYQMVLADLTARQVPKAKMWSALSAFGGQRGEGLLLYYFLRKKYQGQVPPPIEKQIVKHRNLALVLLLVILGWFALVVFFMIR